MTGTVFQIQRYCIRDGTGIRTCVFLKGCPLRCPWCHNPEGIAYEPQTDVSGRVFGVKMTDEQVFAELVKDKAYYAHSGGGVTFTGGEPLMQPEFVVEIAKLAKSAGISVSVETCGNVPQKNVKAVLPYIDGVLFDIKSLDGQKLKSVVGATPSVIFDSLDMFSAAGIPITLRCPMISGFNNSEEHFASVGKLAASTKGVVKVELLPYHSLGIEKGKKLGIAQRVFDEILPEDIARALTAVKKHFADVAVV